MRRQCLCLFLVQCLPPIKIWRFIELFCKDPLRSLLAHTSGTTWGTWCDAWRRRHKDQGETLPMNEVDFSLFIWTSKKWWAWHMNYTSTVYRSIERRITCIYQVYRVSQLHNQIISIFCHLRECNLKRLAKRPNLCKLVWTTQLSREIFFLPSIHDLIYIHTNK